MKKAAVDWMIIVGAIIALLILGATIYFIKVGTTSASDNIKNLQSCEGQKGKCKPSCELSEMANYKSLGCGSGDFKGKDYCCIPNQ